MNNQNNYFINTDSALSCALTNGAIIGPILSKTLRVPERYVEDAMVALFLDTLLKANDPDSPLEASSENANTALSLCVLKITKLLEEAQPYSIFAKDKVLLKLKADTFMALFKEQLAFVVASQDLVFDEDKRKAVYQSFFNKFINPNPTHVELSADAPVLPPTKPTLFSDVAAGAALDGGQSSDTFSDMDILFEQHTRGTIQDKIKNKLSENKMIENPSAIDLPARKF